MRWEDQLVDLFEDLEQQAQDLHAAERAPELADRRRAEYRGVTLASRLMASVGRELVLEVPGVGPVSGVLQRLAQGWCLVRGSGQEWVLPLDAVDLLTGLSTRSVPEVAWPRVASLGLGAALRRLGEQHLPCVLHLRSGARHEGTLARVGADFVELDLDAGRTVLVAFSALAAVQSRGEEVPA